MTLSVEKNAPQVSFPHVVAAPENSMRALIDHTMLQTIRILKRWRADWAALVQAFLFPCLMLLMFRVVLGNSIDATSVITGQRGIYGTAPMLCIIAAMSGASINAMLLHADRQAGLLSRFATMPIHRAADLLGRLIAEVIRIVITTALILTIAHFLGFRFERGWLAAVGTVAVVVGFGIAFVMVMTAGTALTQGPQIVQWLNVLTTLLLFFNTGFVPLMAYPTWLQDVVANQPLSCAIDSIRALTDSRYLIDPSIPLAKTAAWSVGLFAISFMPAIVGYRRSVSA
ncbi:MAG: ABC transporter permease [Nocardiaceae bacterium]|nr:ABC transporter permease [Nocardiaceae bacterium]